MPCTSIIRQDAHPIVALLQWYLSIYGGIVRWKVESLGVRNLNEIGNLEWIKFHHPQGNHKVPP